MKKGLTFHFIHCLVALPIFPLLSDRTFLTSKNAQLISKISEYLQKNSIVVQPKNTHIRDAKKTVIFYGNHRNLFDPLLVMYGLKLVMCKVVATLTISKLFPALESSIIPVSSRSLAKNWDIVSIGRKFAANAEGLNAIQANDLNKQVPQKAVEALMNGDSLIIFPSGGIEYRSWFPGLGYILYDYWEKVGKDIELQPFHLVGNTNHAFLWHNFLMFLRRRHVMEVRMEVGKPISLSEIKSHCGWNSDRKETAGKIVLYLEHCYRREFD